MRQQPLGRVGAAIEHDVFAGLAQLRADRLVDRELAGVDDAHVHAGLDRVIQYLPRPGTGTTDTGKSASTPAPSYACNQ